MTILDIIQTDWFKQALIDDSVYDHKFADKLAELGIRITHGGYKIVLISEDEDYVYKIEDGGLDSASESDPNIDEMTEPHETSFSMIDEIIMSRTIKEYGYDSRFVFVEPVGFFNLENRKYMIGKQKKCVIKPADIVCIDDFLEEIFEYSLHQQLNFMHNHYSNEETRNEIATTYRMIAEYYEITDSIERERWYKAYMSYFTEYFDDYDIIRYYFEGDTDFIDFLGYMDIHDLHEYNLGWLDGNLVIIDFLS